MTETTDKPDGFFEAIKTFWRGEHPSIQVVGRGTLVKDAKRIADSDKFRDYISKSKKLVKAKNK